MKSCQNCCQQQLDSTYPQSKDVVVVRKSFNWTDALTVSSMLFLILCLTVLSLYVAVTIRAGKDTPELIQAVTHKEGRKDVFYHVIIPRGGTFVFSTYSHYLTAMAEKYPNLQFTLYLLLDDSLYSLSRDQKFAFISNFIYKMDPENRNKMTSYLRKHPNFNIIFMTVSNFMSTTPMRYQYRFVQRSSLLLYMRIFSVYQDGGISIDLETYSNNLYLNQEIDETAISTILSKHNDGFNVNDYGEMIKNLQEYKEEELTLTVFTILSKIVREMTDVFEQNIFVEESSEIIKPLTRTHRDKREIQKLAKNNLKPTIVSAVSDKIETKSPKNGFSNEEVNKKAEPTKTGKVGLTNEHKVVVNISPLTDHAQADMATPPKKNNNQMLTNILKPTVDSSVSEKIETLKEFRSTRSNVVDKNTEPTKNIEKVVTKTLHLTSSDNLHLASPQERNVKTNKSLDNTVSPDNNVKTNVTKPTNKVIRIVTFYDFEPWTGTLVPYYQPSYTLCRYNKNGTKDNETYNGYLSFDPHGTFIASTAKEHPFLGLILPRGKCLSSLKYGGLQFAMKNVYNELCSKSVYYSDYCKNIFVI